MYRRIYIFSVSIYYRCVGDFDADPSLPKGHYLTNGYSQRIGLRQSFIMAAQEQRLSVCGMGVQL
jgi:hypothetical protein